jgi:SAM-dependent methyltransferase
MSKHISPMELDALEPEKAEAAIFSRFGGLRRNRQFVRDSLKWHAEVSPRPNFYFRWHLPRLVTTCELLADVFSGHRDSHVLDIATFAPYAILTESYLRNRGIGIRWDRTSLNGETESFASPDGTFEVKSRPCVLGGERFPMPDSHYDAVVLTEVIEHINQHPQLVLGECNRILKPGGLMIVTTPNSSGWKKIRAAIEGHPEYDSPTFCGGWGHRYEFSYYDMQESFLRSGFSIIRQFARDVYFDDPTGVRQFIERTAVVAGNVLTGRVKVAAKMWLRRGSGLFIVGRKENPAPAEPDLLSI